MAPFPWPDLPTLLLLRCRGARLPKLGASYAFPLPGLPPPSVCVIVFLPQGKPRNLDRSCLHLANSAALSACRNLQACFSAQETGEICNHTYAWNSCVWFSHLVIQKFLLSKSCSSKCVRKGAVLASLGACWKCPVSNSTQIYPIRAVISPRSQVVQMHTEVQGTSL